MAVYVTGDTHGTNGIYKLSYHNFNIGRTLNRDDFVIISGDFGLGFYPPDNHRYEEHKVAIEWLSSMPWTTLFVDGNHENFDLINGLEEIDMFGDKVGVFYDNIFHLKRGRVYNINEKNILTLGGASSIDKDKRIVNHINGGIKSWWEDELWTVKDEELLIDNMNKYDWEVDYVISHTAPRNVLNKMFTPIYINGGRYNDPVSNFFETILTKYNIKFKKWFFGHMHMDIDNGDFICLYNDKRLIWG